MGLFKFIRQLLCSHTPYKFVALGDAGGMKVCKKCGKNYR